MPVCALRDARLSLKAKALFAIILAWPPDEHLTVTKLVDWTSDGRIAIENAWRELEAIGYLIEEPEGYTIAENVQSSTVEVAGFMQKARRVTTSTKTTVPLVPKLEQALDTLAGIAQNLQPPSGRIARKRQKGVCGPEHETCKNVGGNCRFHAINKSAPETSIHHQDNNQVTEVFELQDDVPPLSHLLDGLDETERQRASCFRLSWIGRFERMAPVLNDEAMLGVDIRHYFDRIMSWSNKMKPTLKKNQRPVDGWIDTVRDAMRRDKQEGKLVMIGQRDAKRSSALEFLKLGRTA